MLSSLIILSIIFISIAISGRFQGLFPIKDLISYFFQIPPACIQYVWIKKKENNLQIRSACWGRRRSGFTTQPAKG